MATAKRLHVESHFDPATSTFSHIVLDRSTNRCALVDKIGRASCRERV